MLSAARCTEIARDQAHPHADRQAGRRFFDHLPRSERHRRLCACRHAHVQADETESSGPFTFLLSASNKVPRRFLDRKNGRRPDPANGIRAGHRRGIGQSVGDRLCQNPPVPKPNARPILWRLRTLRRPRRHGGRQAAATRRAESTIVDCTGDEPRSYAKDRRSPSITNDIMTPNHTQILSVGSRTAKTGLERGRYGRAVPRPGTGRRDGDQLPRAHGRHPLLGAGPAEFRRTGALHPFSTRAKSPTITLRRVLLSAKPGVHPPR